MFKDLLRRVVLGSLLLGLSSAVYAFVVDVLIHTPAAYDTFVPPAVGWSYNDPAFATKIKRVSSATTMPNNSGSGNLEFVSTEYSTMSAFNKDNTRFILQHQSYFGLYDAAGVYLKDLPFAVSASTEPRWSRTSPSILYYVNGNDLLKLDVNTDVTTLVHSFGEYSTISGKGESDISFDGDYFVFAGDDRYVFVYQISTNTKGPVFDTAGQAFDSLYITPNNNVTITWIQTGTGPRTGIELFNKGMVFQRQVTHAGGHMDVSRDTNGDEILLWTNSNDASPIPNCQNGIVKVKLANAQQTCLLQLDWSLAVHVSAPDGMGWVFVETYSDTDMDPNSPAWKPYTNEVVQVKLDGTQTRRLFHHRSRPSNDYGYMPRVNVNRTGTKLLYTSNYNLSAILGWPADYSDVYMVNVPTGVSASR